MKRDDPVSNRERHSGSREGLKSAWKRLVATVVVALLLATGGCETTFGPSDPTIDLTVRPGEQLMASVGEPPSQYAWGLFNNDVVVRQVRQEVPVEPVFLKVCAVQVEVDSVTGRGCTEQLSLRAGQLSSGFKVGDLAQESFWFLPDEIGLLKGAPDRLVEAEGSAFIGAREPEVVATLRSSASLGEGESLIAVYARYPESVLAHDPRFDLRVRPFGLVFE